MWVPGGYPWWYPAVRRPHLHVRGPYHHAVHITGYVTLRIDTFGGTGGQRRDGNVRLTVTTTVTDNDGEQYFTFGS